MLSVPWQVTHGQWIGWTAAAAFIVLGGLLFWLWVRWLARRREARVLRAFGAGTASLEIGPVVLRGRLEVPGAPVVSLDGSGAAAACTVEASAESLRFVPLASGVRACFRAPSLHVVTPDGSTVLRGPVMVAAGSRESLPGKLSRLDADDRVRLLAQPDGVVTFRFGSWPKDLGLSGAIRTLRHGDEVIVRGTVRRSLGDGGPGASYRPTVTALEVVPAEGCEVIEVTAARVGVISFGKAAMLVRGLAVGLALSLGAGAAIGGAARGVDDFETAALVPPHRGWAIDQLARRASEGPPSQQRLASVLAYHDLAPDCRRTGEALVAHGQWAHAADMLAGCEDEPSKRLAVTALRVEGDFSRACEVAAQASLPATRQEAAFLLLGGCQAQASSVLRRAAEQPSTGDETVTTLRCLADAIDARAGDASVAARLASEMSEPCRLAHADGLTGLARVQALAPLVEAPLPEQTRHRHAGIRALLLAEQGTPPALPISLPVPPVLELISHPDRFAAGRAHGLEHDVMMMLVAIKEPQRDQRSLRRDLALRAAAFEILAGNVDEALSLLDLVEKDSSVLRTDVAISSSSEAWVGVLVAEARAASLRALALVLRGEVEAAAKALAPWHDTAPSRFLHDMPVSTDLPSALMRIRGEVVRHLDDAAVVVSAARGKTEGGKTVSEDMLAALLEMDPTTLPPSGPTSFGPLHGVPWVVRAQSVPADVDARMAWILYASRVPSNSPPLSMWEASVAARVASAAGAVEAMDRHSSVAKAHRAALMRRPATTILALLSAD
jgi:hypothetical protein